MTWKINWSNEAIKQLRKLDKSLQNKIIDYLNNRILTTQHPHDFGKSLRHDKHGLWRYRIENIRIICHIRENEALILILGVGHRKNIYH